MVWSGKPRTVSDQVMSVLYLSQSVFVVNCTRPALHIHRGYRTRGPFKHSSLSITVDILMSTIIHLQTPGTSVAMSPMP